MTKFYVKYYPTDYENYPKGNQRNSWTREQYGQSFFLYCNRYDKSENIDIFSLSCLNSKELIYDMNTLKLDISPVGKVRLKEEYVYYYMENYYEGEGLNVSITTYRDDFITLINNLNKYTGDNWQTQGARHWENINLDLWVYQWTGEQSSGRRLYYIIPIFYAGNNPNADYTVEL